MGALQVVNSFGRIFKNGRISSTVGIFRYACWQFYRLFSRFPRRVFFSSSFVSISANSRSIGSLIYVHELFDFNNMNFVRELSNFGIKFMDVGANIGVYSLLVTENLSSSAVAIEAHPDTCRALRKNFEENARNNALAVNLAAFSEDGSIEIIDTPLSSVTRIARNDDTSTVSVRAARLDNFCQSIDFIPDVLKIDVEGSEEAVIKGLSGIIEGISVIFVEINGLSEKRANGAAPIIQALRFGGFEGPFVLEWKGNFAELKPGTSLMEDCVFISTARLFNLGIPADLVRFN